MATPFTYDKAGNLLKDNKAEYTYDAFNRTEKVETFDGHVQINRYDAEGLRHELEEDGKLVQFIFRGDEAATEEKDSNIIRFIRGYDLIASDAENARTYYHYASDEMSSITHVVTAEEKECGEEPQQNPQTSSSDKANGIVLNHYEYDAWGNTTVCEETVENRFKFNGQQLDPITQQYYLRARFYNPVIARFTQEDSYRGDGLNLYAYCKNNPVYYEDPSGHWCDRKEKVYKDLLKERGITEADLANDPDLKLSLMAEASNIVKSQKKNNSSENQPNAPEASNPNAESELVKVGRWMSRDEYNKMNSSGYVQKPYKADQSYVAYPASYDAYYKQADRGSVYIEFDVPYSSIRKTKDSWATIPGPNSIYSKLNVKKGLPPIENFPKATNIKLIGEKH